MTITIEDVKKVAKLARLKFSEDEYQNFTSQLSNIMEMIDPILDVDCEGIEPLTSVNNASLRMRKDEIEEAHNIEELFANAPGKDAALAKEIKCFIVPKVVE